MNSNNVHMQIPGVRHASHIPHRIAVSIVTRDIYQKGFHAVNGRYNKLDTYTPSKFRLDVLPNMRSLSHQGG